MRKLLSIGLIFGSAVFTLGSTEASAAATTVASVETTDAQVWQDRQRSRRWRGQRPQPRPRYQRGARTYTTTRIVFIGRQRYRETIRVTQLPNGRTRTQVISRVRIGIR